MDPKRSAGAVGGGSGLKVANILDRPIAKRTGTSEVRLFGDAFLAVGKGTDGQRMDVPVRICLDSHHHSLDRSPS